MTSEALIARLARSLSHTPMRSTSEIVLESADVDKTTAAKKWAPRDWRADLTDVSLYSVRGGGVEEKRDGA